MSSIALMFISASMTFNLPPGLLSAVCFVESRHTVRAVNVNDGNSHSYGICQVKLETARQMGYKGTVAGLMAPRTNVYYAAAYLSSRLKVNRGDVVCGVSAYNAGTYRGDKNGAPRNITYVRDVLTAWAERK